MKRLSRWVGWIGFSLLTGCLFETQTLTPPITSAPEYFTRSIDGLDFAQPTQTVSLNDGDTLRVTATPVKKILNGKAVRMLAYNGMIPGPTIRVEEGAEITVILKNLSGLETTLHSHGIRLDARYDGIPDSAQPAIPQGGSATYKIKFPDPGMYWYHSHVREDYSQELGLYGNYFVVAKDSTYWAPVNREVTLMIGDVLMDTGGIAPYRLDGADHILMGRFGNLFLINGDTASTLHVKRKEVLRFFVTNVCDSRVLNIGLKGLSMKVVGSDNGRFTAATFPGFNYVAPGERMAFEYYFADTGTVKLIHSTPMGETVMTRIVVDADSVTTNFDSAFNTPGFSAAALAGIAPFKPDFDKPPDENLTLTVRLGAPMLMTSPMKVAADMQITSTMEVTSTAQVTSPVQIAASAHDPTGKGIEWSDNMGVMNSAATTENTHWIARDTRTGKENMDIHWDFQQGDHIKIRIFNDSVSAHPMPHPVHFHGQRFLVTAINGQKNTELGWKDTYLVGVGETADILLDASNPGDWMAHCHISEHMESMMMFTFTVKPTPGASGP